MVVLNRIYTRTGDDGTSALATGERRQKSDLRFSAIGTVDETNATIGLARLHREALGPMDAMLAAIQNDLFDLGADLATPEKTTGRERLRITAAQVERLEGEIDSLNARLHPLTSFVLPGGTPTAAALHLARTVCRRAERLAVAAQPAAGFDYVLVRYLNRLADLLFVLAREANRVYGVAEEPWDKDV